MPVGGGKFKSSTHMSPVAEEAVWKERIGKLNTSLSRQPTASFNINPYVSPQSKHDRCSPVAEPIGRRRPGGVGGGGVRSSSQSTSTTTTNINNSGIPTSSSSQPISSRARPPQSKADRVLSETVTKADVSGIMWQHVKQPVFTSDMKVLTNNNKRNIGVRQPARQPHVNGGAESVDEEDHIVDYCTTFRILKTAAKSASAKICGGGGGGADRGTTGGNKNISGGAMLGADTDTTSHDVLAEQVHLVNSLLNNHNNNTTPTITSNFRNNTSSPSITGESAKRSSSKVTKADLRWARSQMGLGGGNNSSTTQKKKVVVTTAPNTPTFNTTTTTTTTGGTQTTTASVMRSCMSPLGYRTTNEKGNDEDGGSVRGDGGRNNATYVPHDTARLEKAKEAILNARARLPQERHAAPVTSAMGVGWVEGGVAKKRTPGLSQPTHTNTQHHESNMAALDGAAAFTIADKKALRNVLRGYDEEEALQEQRDRAAQQRASSAMMFGNANLDKMNDGSPARNRRHSSIDSSDNIVLPLSQECGGSSLQRGHHQHISRGPSPVPTTGHSSYQSAAAAARQKINVDRSNAFTLAPQTTSTITTTTKPPMVPLVSSPPPPLRASTSLAYTSPSFASQDSQSVDQERLWSVTPQPTPNAHRNQKYLHFNKDKKLTEITQFSCRTGLFDGLTKSSKLKS